VSRRPPPGASPGTFSARALRAGSLAHYEDAAYYDRVYRRRVADARFYAELARAGGGPVLELGAGTGRVTVEIARAGLPIVGVERVPAMLRRARERLAGLGDEERARVLLLRRDFLRLRLGRRFETVIAPFNAFMHLYSRRDVERALAVCAAHLAPRGRLAFDVLLPDCRELARSPSRLYRDRPFVHPVDGRRYAYAEAFDFDLLSQVQMVSMVFEEIGRPAHRFVAPLAHRQFFPAELEALLHYNGFEVERRSGDFEGGPLTASSESQVIVARARPLGVNRRRRASRAP
jgi:SAM-dependent methyltransferase